VAYEIHCNRNVFGRGEGGSLWVGSRGRRELYVEKKVMLLNYF